MSGRATFGRARCYVTGWTCLACSGRLPLCAGRRPQSQRHSLAGSGRVPLAAAPGLPGEIPLGISLEAAQAARALEPQGPIPVLDRDALAGEDVISADEARCGSLIRGIEYHKVTQDGHHEASTRIRPRSIPIWQVNSCSPGSPDMNSIGTTVPVGSG